MLKIRKGQGFFNFFLNLGWTIFVILAVIGALLYFGVIPVPFHGVVAPVGVAGWCLNQSMEPAYHGLQVDYTRCLKTVRFCETFENNYTKCDMVKEVYNLSVVKAEVVA